MALRTPVNNMDHIQGNDSALIEFVEYGDYECSYCGRAYPVIKQLQKLMGDNLKFVFRNFPLVDIHPRAYNAAIAAEVSADFGKFWEMHDMLYENQGNLTDRDLINYAENLGIEIKEFEQKFSDPKYQNKVEADIESGLRSGVNGTPSIYINGQKYQGDPYSVQAFVDYFKSM